jgi:hypothetical protein
MGLGALGTTQETTMKIAIFALGIVLAVATFGSRA